MSGVDERVETLRAYIEAASDPTALGSFSKHEPLAALDSLAASVASLEQRADEAEEIAELLWTYYLLVMPDEKHTRVQTYFAALAAAVVSAEPTEDTA